ncbi:MAG: hypothetical protein AB8V23_01040 [Candidatus Midichloria sp.]
MENPPFAHLQASLAREGHDKKVDEPFLKVGRAYIMSQIKSGKYLKGIRIREGTNMRKAWFLLKRLDQFKMRPDIIDAVE